MTTTTRVPRWQLRDDARELGKLCARSGRPRQTCPLTDPEMQAEFLAGWQSEIAVMGAEIGRLDWAEAELDASEPQPASNWWWVAAIVAALAFAVGCSLLGRWLTT